MLAKKYMKKVFSLDFIKNELYKEGIFGAWLRSKPNRVLWLFLRMVYWKNKFYRCGNNVRIYSGAMIENPKKISVGDNFYFLSNSYVGCSDKGRIKINGNGHLGVGAKIQSLGKIEIGSGVEIGANAVILSHTADTTHGHSGSVTSAPRKLFTTIIEDDVQIGTGAIILGGSHIKKGGVVGAGAVVKGIVEPYNVVGGIPARYIKQRMH